ncbi:3640_t:CDS:2, partial [Racocetra fulgida]
ILEEKPDIFSNQEVFEIANDIHDNFYTSCKRIASVFEPIKRVINLLESNTASLADCFLGIVQIAAMLKKIPTSNNFRTLAISAFNFRYQQFDISPYLLAYFLHPKYRSRGLKTRNFHNIHNLAVNYYKDLFHKEEECNELVDQLIRYKAELKFYKDNFVETELRNSTLSETVISEIDYPNSIEKNEEEVEIVSSAESDITMALQSLVDLSDQIFEVNNNPSFIDEEMNTNLQIYTNFVHVVENMDVILHFE